MRVALVVDRMTTRDPKVHAASPATKADGLQDRYIGRRRKLTAAAADSQAPVMPAPT